MEDRLDELKLEIAARQMEAGQAGAALADALDEAIKLVSLREAQVYFEVGDNAEAINCHSFEAGWLRGLRKLRRVLLNIPEPGNRSISRLVGVLSQEEVSSRDGDSPRPGGAAPITQDAPEAEPSWKPKQNPV